jgi:transcriptional regulator with PAS, ATPase and Fis domain
MLLLFERIAAVAPTEASVGINGETGSGKDLVAQAIHKRSNRAAGPFVPVNCATIAREVFESHLFGSEKGSFTGAVADRPGLIASADGGTIFLDEIGELPLDLQAKLLRTVETGEVLRVGATKPIRVDVRFVAGTHRDLHAMARAGLFREDLIYRLYVLTVDVPPLRMRLDDLLLLWDELAKRHVRRPMRPALSAEVKKLLLEHRWPGNVRELQNVVQRAFAVMRGPDLLPAHIVFDKGAAPLPPPIEGFLAADALSLEQVEVLNLRAALLRHKGNRTKAAEDLKISRATLQRKIAKYGLEREGLADEEEGEE